MSDGLHGHHDNEPNPQLPESPALGEPVKRHRLLSTCSQEPTYYEASAPMPADHEGTHAAVEYMRGHARRFLGENCADLFSAQYLKMFTEQARGKRVRIKIELTVEDHDDA